ncbi:MAG: GHKL domain-containing protein [Lachnospiraceae bacterium]|nr:GHKL domain-containing protein [Lachnospiraceae bacterium]MBR5677989.1 GHKL domain-containing protein [Paludibacteraceae bacterium]
MILWGIDYLINYLSYYIVYKWILCVPFRKNPVLTIGFPAVMCPVVAILCQSADASGTARFILAFAAIMTLLILVESRHIMVLLILPLVFLASSFFSVLVTYTLSSATDIPYPEFMDSHVAGMVSESIFPLVFCICCLVFKRLRAERETVKFSVLQYMLALVGSVFLFLVISISQGMLEEEAKLERLKRPLAVSMVLVGIVFLTLILWQSNVEKKALRYKMENDYYQLCLKRQESHIREIVENDQKIRRFRHDVNAHLTAIEQCVQSNDLPQLKSYVERMRTETQKLEVKKFTGIGVVDAIISEWYQKAKEAKVQWEWDGGLLGETDIEPFDLCIIFSNLLSNAVEAAEQVEEGKDKKIRVSCGMFRDKICIRVSNTCRNNPEVKKRHGTTKSDYQNHGFGLTNIRNTVAKAGGEFRIEEEPGIFNAEVIL